jgi:hypothetical protein
MKRARGELDVQQSVWACTVYPKTFTTHSCPPSRCFCSLNLFSHRIIQGEDWVFSPHMLSTCGLPLPPTCLLLTVNETRSYFASTITFTATLFNKLFSANSRVSWLKGEKTTFQGPSLSSSSGCWCVWNQPTKKLSKGGALSKRKTSSLAILNHSCLRNAQLDFEKEP